MSIPILIFGNTSYPDISFSVDAHQGYDFSCTNNSVLRLGDADEFEKHLGGFVGWTELLFLSSPSICDYGPLYDSDVEAGWQKVWPQMKECLGRLCQSKGERSFLEAYFTFCETDNLSRKRKGHDLGRCPALIPQVWLNWIHYDPRNKERAARTKREPFRVDFVMLDKGRKLVFEIDGQSHFSELVDVDQSSGLISWEASMAKYTEHLKKDRWLRSHGWEVWRFSDLEVFNEQSDFREEFESIRLSISSFGR